jgi:hypothetical protein
MFCSSFYYFFIVHVLHNNHKNTHLSNQIREFIDHLYAHNQTV